METEEVAGIQCYIALGCIPSPNRLADAKVEGKYLGVQDHLELFNQWAYTPTVVPGHELKLSTLFNPRYFGESQMTS